MNPILTDDEIGAIQTQVLADFRRHVQEEGRGTASPASIARAVEAAVLAKLAQQEPIGYLPSYEADRLKSGHDARLRSAKFGPSQLDGDVPLYTHPAPQQADRPRVPDELDWRHPRIQALIGADARSRICIDLVWRILENPRGEFTASDMEYWDKLHDKVQEVALAAAPEAPAQEGGAA